MGLKSCRWMVLWCTFVFSKTINFLIASLINRILKVEDSTNGFKKQKKIRLTGSL